MYLAVLNQHMSFGKEVNAKLASIGDHSSPGLKYLSKLQETKEKNTCL